MAHTIGKLFVYVAKTKRSPIEDIGSRVLRRAFDDDAWESVVGVS